jgi:transglutaminase-like putative cysteine protease
MDIRKAFTVSAFLLVLTGILSLSVAEGDPALILGASAASWFAFNRAERQGRALSRLATNLLVFLVVLLLPVDYMRVGDPVVTVTHFLLAVQVVMLFGKKAQREYALLFMISLVHLGVSAVLTIELAFSVAFVVYMIVGTWTLVLYLLVRELDARAPGESPQVRGGRGLLSTTAGISVATLLLTVVFFFLFPRISAKLFDVSRHRARQNTVGFTDQIGLTDLSSIKENPEVVLHVKVERYGKLPAEPKWRGLAFDRYDAGHWDRSWHHGRTDEVSKFAGFLPGPEGGWRAKRAHRGPPPPEEVATYTILQAPLGVESSTLFGAPAVEEIEFLSQDRPGSPIFDMGDAVLGPGLPATEVYYRVKSAPPRREDAKLVDAAPPGKVDGVDYLQLPGGTLPGRLRELATRVCQGARTPYERAAALEKYLTSEFSYTIDLDSLEKAPEGTDPIEHFLFTTKKGHCELSASAFVLMCRTLGLPVRLVNGFQTGQWNDLGGYFQVRQMEAHAWAEVYFGPAVGWVDFDPTPWNSAGGGGFLSFFEKVQDYLRYRWLNYVISYTISDQLSMADRARKRLDAWRVELVALMERLRRQVPDISTPAVARLMAYIAGLLAMLFALVWYLYTRRLRPPARRAAARARPPRPVPFFDELIRALERRGYRRLPSETAREFGLRVWREGGIAFAGVVGVVESFYRIRFGEGELTPREVEDAEAVLRALSGKPSSP